jgi:sulfonate transport system permease protein
VTQALDSGPATSANDAVIQASATMKGLDHGPTLASSPAGKQDFRARRVVAFRRFPHRLIGAFLFFGGWWALTASGVLDAQTLAGPGRVWSVGWDLVANGQLQHHLWVSLQRVIWGLLLGISVGTLLALISGLSRTGEAVVDAPVQIMRALPILALQPLFVIWFGIGEEMKIVLIAFAVAFPIYLNTYAGVTGVDARHLELAHAVRLRRLDLLRKVVLPGATANFLVGLRYAFAISWLVLILSESVNATSGLGYLVNQAQISGQTDVIVLTLVIYGLLGLLSDLLVRLLERRALRWRTTDQPALRGACGTRRS